LQDGRGEVAERRRLPEAACAHCTDARAGSYAYVRGGRGRGDPGGRGPPPPPPPRRRRRSSGEGRFGKFFSLGLYGENFIPHEYIGCLVCHRDGKRRRSDVAGRGRRRIVKIQGRDPFVRVASDSYFTRSTSSTSLATCSRCAAAGRRAHRAPASNCARFGISSNLPPQRRGTPRLVRYS